MTPLPPPNTLSLGNLILKSQCVGGAKDVLV